MSLCACSEANLPPCCAPEDIEDGAHMRLQHPVNPFPKLLLHQLLQTTCITSQDHRWSLPNPSRLTSTKHCLM